MGSDDMRATFILRLWREPEAPAGEWRGELVHVQSRRTERTADVAAIFTVVQAELAHLEQQDTRRNALPP